MTKFGLEILRVLFENNIDTASMAISISQIAELISEKYRKSYSTTYRHLQTMITQGYVKCGLVDCLANTYFIADKGKEFYKLQGGC